MKKVKKPSRERSAFEDDSMSSLSSISSDNEDVGLVPAKKAREEKPVQIDTSIIKVVATIKKVAKPRTKP